MALFGRKKHQEEPRSTQLRRTQNSRRLSHGGSPLPQRILKENALEAHRRLSKRRTAASPHNPPKSTLVCRSIQSGRASDTLEIACGCAAYCVQVGTFPAATPISSFDGIRFCLQIRDKSSRIKGPSRGFIRIRGFSHEHRAARRTTGLGIRRPWAPPTLH